MGVFSLAGWAPRIQTGLHVSRPTQDTAIACLDYLYGAFTRYGPTFQTVPVLGQGHRAVLRPHGCRNNRGLGCFLFARRYSGNRGFFLFLRLLRCFSSAGWLSIYHRVTALQTAGLPHSDISGSILFGRSPELFAAVHVLRSLHKPRHPPYALAYFLT